MQRGSIVTGESRSTGACCCLNVAVGMVQSPDAMIPGIRNPEVSVAVDGQSGGAVQSRLTSVTSVTGEARLACTCDDLDCPRLGTVLENLIAPSIREDDGPRLVDDELIGGQQIEGKPQTARGCQTRAAGPDHRLDDIGDGGDPSQAVLEGVAHIEVPRAGNDDPRGFVKRGLSCLEPIADSGGAAGQSRDLAGSEVGGGQWKDIDLCLRLATAMLDCQRLTSARQRRGNERELGRIRERNGADDDVAYHHD